MIRFHKCDISRKDIQDRSKHSIKLTNLPRNTTARDLTDLGRMVEVSAGILPRARSNYNYLQHAYFYFQTAALCEDAKQVSDLSLNGKCLEWTDSKKKLCAICSSAHHNASTCPKKRYNPKDRSTQQLYQRYQPVQFNNYSAPAKPYQRGAVRDNIPFVDAIKSGPKKFNNQQQQKPIE